MKRIIILLLSLCIAYGNTVKAEDTDLTTIDNVIYVTPTSAEVGKTATLSICMKNTAPIRGFQFNLYLPEGVTAVKNSKGRIQASLTKVRLEKDDEHTLSVSEQEDGSLLFLCGSQYDENFLGNEGEIATLTVTITDDVAIGMYPLVLKNIKLTETDISKYYVTETVQTTLTISITDRIYGIDGVTTTKHDYFDLQGRRVNIPSKGVYIKNGKKTVVK